MDWADIGAELPMLGVLGLSDDRPIITVRDNQRDDRRSGGGDKSPKSSPFTFAFSCLLAMGLIAGSGVFSRHAVYACRGRDDSSYYLFMLFSFLRGAKYLNETGFIGDEQRPSNSYCSR